MSGLAFPFVALADGEANFSLQPVTYDPSIPETKSYFVFSSRPGEHAENVVRVTNNGNIAGTAYLYVVDATTGQTSGTVFLPRESPGDKSRTWVALDQQELFLQPGESKVVAVRVAIPDNAQPGQYLSGIVAENAQLNTSQATNTGANTAGFQVNIRSRTVLALQVNLPGATVEQVNITGVMSSGSDRVQTLVLSLHNSGTQMVKPVGTFIVTDMRGQEVQRLPIKLNTFLPQTTIEYPVTVQKQALGAGQYHAKVSLTYGTSGVTNYESDFTITAAQVAQAFPSAAPALAPPPVAANDTPATIGAAAQSQWPLFAAGAVLVVLALSGGIFLGRRGRATGAAK